MKRVPGFKRAGPRSRWGRIARLLTWALGMLVSIIMAAFIFAKNLLCIESGPRHGEVIVVLGGESADRGAKTLELFREGAARRIIISGDGDTYVIAQQLMLAGVPSEVIELENRSRNTKENAEFTVQLLKKRGVRRALIVTSWFHSRRALNSSFCYFAPEMQFSSLPTRQNQAWPAEATHIYQEYLKTVWYYFRYGISPWQASAS